MGNLNCTKTESLFTLSVLDRLNIYLRQIRTSTPQLKIAHTTTLYCKLVITSCKLIFSNTGINLNKLINPGTQLFEKSANFNSLHSGYTLPEKKMILRFNYTVQFGRQERGAVGMQ